MARSFVLAVVAFGSLVVGGLAGCHTGRSPELRVLGIHEEPRQDIVFVQVTNPARHAMRLTRLQYTFAAGGATVSAGDVALAREVPPGAAVVVEVPLDKRSEIAGGGDPDGFAGGAGVRPRGIDKRSEIAGGGDPDGFAGGAGVRPRGIDSTSEKPLTMSGTLTAELDKIVRTFSVSAQFQRPSS